VRAKLWFGGSWEKLDKQPVEDGAVASGFDEASGQGLPQDRPLHTEHGNGVKGIHDFCGARSDAMASQGGYEGEDPLPHTSRKSTRAALGGR